MELTTSKQRKFKQLEEWTGVASDRWSALSLGRQRPTAEMIEGLCKHFPELALWITTGTTDPENRQWDVETAQARRERSITKILKMKPEEISREDELVMMSEWKLASGLDDTERKFAKLLLLEIVSLNERLDAIRKSSKDSVHGDQES